MSNLVQTPIELIDDKEGKLLIRERNPQFMEQNFREKMDILAEEYESCNPRKRVRSIRSLLNKARSPRDELQNKASIHEEYFRRKLFNKIVHTSEFRAEDQHVLLQSPNILGSANASSRIDEEIGNTDYVFASADLLRSNSSHWGVEYEIASRDCYVVPMDIAHLHEQDLGDDEQRLIMYAKNIYTYDDFVRFFSTYSALIFDDPQETIDFFSSHWWYPDKAEAWSSKSYDDENLDPKTHLVLKKMSHLYLGKGIVPPISPEFQYRDSVEGIKIDEN